MYRSSNKKGFAIAMTMVLGMAILIMSAAVYSFLRQTAHSNQVTIKEDKAIGCVDAIKNKAIKIIQAQPDLIVQGAFTQIENPDNIGSNIFIVNDDDGKQICRGGARSQRIPPDGVTFEDEVFLIEATAWNTTKANDTSTIPNESGVRVYSWVGLASMGPYMFASKGDLSIRALEADNSVMDLSQACIYGRFLNFLGADATHRIKLDCAHTETSYSPGDAWWDAPAFLGDGNPDNDPVQILNSNNGGKPDQLLAPVVFLTITDTFNYFSEIQFPIIPIDPTTQLQNRSTPLSPPSQEFSTSDDAHHYYLYTGDVTIGNIDVRGQVVIMTEGRAIINHDIRKLNKHGRLTAVALSDLNLTWDGTDQTVNYNDTGANASSANQLTIIARGGIKIHPRWCEQPGQTDKTLTVQALLIAPDGTFEVDESLDSDLPNNPCRNNPGDKKLDFTGAMWMASQPVGLVDYFQGERNYAYDPTIRYDPPPLLKSHEVIREFVIRTALPIPIPTP